MRYNIQNVYKILFVLLVINLLTSCEKDPPVQNNEIELSTEGSNYEGFTLVWTQIDSAEDYTVLISSDADFQNLIVDITLTPDRKKYTISGLQTLSTYYCKVSATITDKDPVHSEKLSVFINYTLDEVDIPTPEKIVLSGNVYYHPERIIDSLGCVIFMHEINRDKKRWVETDVVDSLVMRGYICLCFDFRGHGLSSSIPNVITLLESNNGDLEEDVASSIAFMQSTYNLNDKAFTLVGASLGAIAATGGSSFNDVVGAVAVSSYYDFTLATFGAGVIPKGVFYLGAAEDNNGGMNMVDEINDLFEITLDPKDLFIKDESSLHGVDLIRTDRDLKNLMMEWIDQLPKTLSGQGD